MCNLVYSKIILTVFSLRISFVHFLHPLTISLAYIFFCCLIIPWNPFIYSFSTIYWPKLSESRSWKLIDYFITGREWRKNPIKNLNALLWHLQGKKNLLVFFWLHFVSEQFSGMQFMRRGLISWINFYCPFFLPDFFYRRVF